MLLIAPHREWLIISLDLQGAPDAEKVIMGLRAVAVLGLLTIPLNHLLLKRLARDGRDGADRRCVRRGERAAPADDRLDPARAAALSMAIGGIGTAISTPAHPVDLDAGFSVNGWLAVLLTFILARIFAEGARMRDDLEGTV